MSYSLPPESYRTLQPERTARPLRVWDVVLTVVFLVALTLFALAVSYAGYFLVFASDACGAATCDYDLMDVGFWTAVISPWVLLLLAVVFAIIQLVRHRLAFWIPLAAAVLMVAMWFVGAAIVGAGVHR